MYTNDKTKRMTLRLTEDQFNFVKANADLLGVSPSDFLRMVINATKATSDKVNTALENRKRELLEKVEASGRENDKADIDDKL